MRRTLTGRQMRGITASVAIVMWSVVVTGSPIHFDSFTLSTDLSLAGDAAILNSSLLLTPAKQNRSGAAWFPEKQTVSAGFETSFQFRLTKPGGLGHGADGFALVLQNAGPHALGGHGSAGGFAVADPYYKKKETAIPWSVAVFFDTFKNSNECDPSDNYVSLCTFGRPDSVGWPARRLAFTPGLPVRLRDQKIHNVRISFKPPLLSVFMDSYPDAVLSSLIDLSIVTDPQGAAWVGFTASTGGGYQNHEILNWHFTSTEVESTLSLVSSQISFLNADCLPDRKLCTPEKSTVTRSGTRSGNGYHIILPGHLAWGASIPNPTGRTFVIKNAHGIVCWNFEEQGQQGCSGPEGSNGATTHELLSPMAPAGSLILKNEKGQTWFSVNGLAGAGFKNNQGFYEFDIEEE